MSTKKDWLVVFLLILVGVVVWRSCWKLLLPPYQTFSDSAKFADIARNLVLGLAINYLFGIECNFYTYLKWREK